MSASIWYEEVNKGLKQEILDTIRVKDIDGSLMPLEEKAITVRVPEQEFKSEVFPCISIYTRETSFAKDRYYPNQFVVSKDTDKGSVVLQDPALPFNLSVQLDFWAEYQEDIDTMTKTWLASHFHDFNLKVVDDGGNTRYCNCLQKSSVTKSDLFKNGKRLFHSIIIYQIWVEINTETQYTKDMVGGFGFNLD